jgi:hypothetical protein
LVLRPGLGDIRWIAYPAARQQNPLGFRKIPEIGERSSGGTLYL